MVKYPSASYYKDIMGPVAFPPAVSILLPVHPVFSAHAELHHRLKTALENVRHQLHKDFSTETANAVMEKLTRLRLQVNYNTPNKSLALFASPHKGKLYYLDTTVEEKIVIGDTFSVRDLVADSKQLRDYLILVLSDQECIFYLAGEKTFERLPSQAPTHVFAYANEAPERVANFSDPGDRKEIVMDKLLHSMDQELTKVLATHPLPVFVLGPEKVLGHFKAHSRHLPQIAGFVHGNYVDAQNGELRSLVQPCLENWRQHQRQSLLDLIQTAVDENRLTTGILNAWAVAWHNQGRVLVVERHYKFPAVHGDSPDRISREDFPENNPLCIQDAVDALISRVISQGGDVEFVEDGDLQKYDHVALIRYY